MAEMSSLPGHLSVFVLKTCLRKILIICFVEQDFLLADRIAVRSRF
jgi:hypothetical protein